MAGLRWIEGGKRIAGIQRPVAKEPISRAMQIVGSAAGDGIDDAAQRPAILGRVTIGKDLEFLHGILRDLGGNTGPSSILVIERLSSIVSVRHEIVAAGNTAETQQAA